MLSHFRACSPALDVELGLTGTYCVESFFSENGSFVLNRRTYSFHDMLLTAEKMNTLNTVSSRNLVKTSKAHTKQESIWHHTDSNNITVSFWIKGLHRAQSMWASFGFHASSPEVYDQSFKAASSNCESSFAETSTMVDTEHDAELESQLRHVVCDDAVNKHFPTLHVPNIGDIHKSTLVSMLNSNEPISSDRLTRVMSRNNRCPQTDVSGDLHLYTDVAFKLNRKLQMGRVQRIYRNHMPSALTSQNQLAFHVQILICRFY